MNDRRSEFMPLYAHVKDSLRQQIRSGILEPGSLLPNSKELSETFGVSGITVRRALQDLTRENLLERVVGVGTYVRKDRPPPRVAIILLGADDVELWRPRSKIFGDLMGGVGTIAWQSWGSFTVARMADVQATEAFLAEEMARAPVDGLLVKPHQAVRPELPEMLERLDLPYVLVKRTFAGKPVNCVVGDDFAEAEGLTTHLIQQGYRRIGFIGPPSDDVFRIRYGGYAAALRAHGISLDEHLVEQARNYDVEHGADWANDLLGHANKPDAIFCAMGTYVARHVLRAIAERGLRIPQDLGFVMHDPDNSGAVFTPSITSAGASNYDLGREAAMLLTRAMADRSLGPSQIVLPPHIVIRRSSRLQTADRVHETGNAK